MLYAVYFLAAAVLAAVLSPIIARFATYMGAVDVPRPPRRLHKYPVPKLGGLVLFFATTLVSLGYILSGAADFHVVPIKFFVGIFIGGTILALSGLLDDKYDLPPSILWLFPAFAALAIVWSGIGIGIQQISNPFGAPIRLDFAILGIPASGIFIWLWMNGMMYTTKFLDGLDGLVAGIGLIASLTLFILSLAPHINQPITATLAIIFAGSLAGYLIYAFHPAKIFLGEGGSTYVGFLLGVLSVILGGKIATALLVMGIPILDVAWVIAQRLWYGRSPFRGDRLHLHYRLIDLGFSQRSTALILYLISGVFGFTAVFLQSFGKLVALVLLFIIMVILISVVYYLYRKQQRAQAAH
jgi:UDP-GlcNAc:undecaprenyl-phosphate/decaprenyl-phosphate GlcNAc-1-phosphate transferase